MESSDAAKKLETAEGHKNKGNEFFKVADFPSAVVWYTEAIDTGVEDPKKQAIYLANRAFAQIKLENYGFAIEDATKAIEKDPMYPKGYYRRASAYFALGKYKNAATNFKRVFDLSGDKDSEEKYKLANKMHKAQLLADAITVQDSIDSIATNLTDIVVPESYTGPRLEEGEQITHEWVVKLCEG